MSRKGILVNEIDRDRYSRIANMNIDEKQVTFPNFTPRITNKDELSSLVSTLTLFPLDYVDAFTVRLDDQPNEIFKNRSSTNQMTLDMKKYANQYLRKFYDKTVEIIDPASEYLYYGSEQARSGLFKQIKYLNSKKKKLESIITYLENIEDIKNKFTKKRYRSKKRSEYRKFWNDISDNPSELYKLIGETHDVEIEYGSDILLPFVPVITNEATLDITKSINKISNAIAPRDSASYLIMNTSTLKNGVLVDKIQEYLLDDPNKLTAIKVKQNIIYKAGYGEQRANTQELMKTMSGRTEEDKDKSYILLEGGPQCFPSAAVGFDMVSTSMTGFDRDATSGGYGGFGGFFIDDKLWCIPYNQTMTRFDKNGGPPCSCPACADIDSLGHRNIGQKRWNALRREHFVYKMDKLMLKIVNSIRERKIELLRSFILKSEVPQLSELIPRM